MKRKKIYGSVIGRGAFKQAVRVSLIILIMAGCCVPFLFQPSQAWALAPNAPNTNAWVTNGVVWAIATSPNAVYLGGSFTYVGPNTGTGASINAATGAVAPPYLQVDDKINAVVPDGSGGWYIGGNFTMVGTVVRNHIAHILSNGTLDSSWDPNADGVVNALVLSGGTLYVGGNFTTIGGQTRSNIAAIDATGAATVWDPTRTIRFTPFRSVAGSYMQGVLLPSSGVGAETISLPSTLRERPPCGTRTPVIRFMPLR